MGEKTPEEIQKLREKLTVHGIEELTSREDVDEFLSRSGTSMVVVNSVCGCAGKAVRKGVSEAIQDLNLDHAGTVFAGEDEEATDELRSRVPDEEPSSPAIYLFQDGNKETYIPRKFTLKHEYDPGKVAEKLQESIAKIRPVRTVG